MGKRRCFDVYVLSEWTEGTQLKRKAVYFGDHGEVIIAVQARGPDGWQTTCENGTLDTLRETLALRYALNEILANALRYAQNAAAECPPSTK